MQVARCQQREGRTTPHAAAAAALRERRALLLLSPQARTLIVLCSLTPHPGVAHHHHCLPIALAFSSFPAASLLSAPPSLSASLTLLPHHRFPSECYALSVLSASCCFAGLSCGILLPSHLKKTERYCWQLQSDYTQGAAAVVRLIQRSSHTATPLHVRCKHGLPRQSAQCNSCRACGMRMRLVGSPRASATRGTTCEAASAASHDTCAHASP